MPEKPVYYTDTLDALKRAERAIGEANNNSTVVAAVVEIYEV